MVRENEIWWEKNLCYMNTDSVINVIIADIEKDLKTKFDTSNYELERLLPMKK